MKKITFVASECQPFIASGGLGDVIGSLPQEVAKNKNYLVDVIVPLYKKIKPEFKEKFEFITKTYINLSWRKQYLGIYKYTDNNVNYYFLDNEYYFKRDNLYGYFDDAERFAFFSKAVIDFMLYTNNIPDIIHANDWQTGLISVYLRTLYYHEEKLKNVKTIFTIHNIEYQGNYDLNQQMIEDVMGISMNDSYLLEYQGRLNIMKAAMECSNKVSTVSNSYAEEITSSEFGHGLEHEVCRVKDEEKLFGILNGIDTKFYNPKTDKAIYKKYDIKTIENKQINKQKLREELNLENNDSLLVAMVTRLVSHKGLNLIIDAFNNIINENIQLVILGTGDPYYENFLKNMENIYPNKLRAIIDYNQALSRKIYAGADLFLMPSVSEPCGLSQMIASRYGTIPLVRQTGGLKDSIKDFNINGNGYTFNSYNGYDIYLTLKRALHDFNSDTWMDKVKQTMSVDFSWKASAKQYIKQYEKLK